MKWNTLSDVLCDKRLSERFLVQKHGLSKEMRTNVTEVQMLRFPCGHTILDFLL
jgi:hypothetical protein